MNFDVCSSPTVQPATLGLLRQLMRVARDFIGGLVTLVILGCGALLLVGLAKSVSEDPSAPLDAAPMQTLPTQVAADAEFISEFGEAD